MEDDTLGIKVIQTEIEKVDYFSKKIELKFFGCLNPIICFIIKEKFKNKTIIDRFENYDYLTDEFI